MIFRVVRVVGDRFEVGRHVHVVFGKQPVDGFF